MTDLGSWRDAAALAARVLIGLLLLGGAVQKAVSPAEGQALLEMRGLPLWLLWPAAVYDLGAALALFAGRAVPAVAASAAAYCAATSFFHLQPEDPWQMTIFVKNWSIAGGCLALAALGPGRLRL